MNHKLYQPASEAEAQAWIAERLACGESLKIRGRVSEALAEEQMGPFVLDTAKLDRTLFFEPDDMVVGVEAGMRVSALHQLLANEGMRLPVNPWRSEERIGALVAGNHFGPDRMERGGIRDHLIGIHYVDGFARLVKAGGKVVKNVSGYDLCRMMIGSRGAFGLITRLHFKLEPSRDQPWVFRSDLEGTAGPAALRRIFAAKIPLDWAQAIWFEGQWQLGLGLSGSEALRLRLLRELSKQGIAGQALDANGLGSAFGSETQRFAGFLEQELRLSAGRSHLHWVAAAQDLLQKTNWKALLEEGEPGERLVLHPFGADLHWFGSPARSEAVHEILSQAGCVLARARRASLGIKVAIHPMEKALKKSLDPNSLYC